jgi:hypothetical protein
VKAFKSTFALVLVLVVLPLTGCGHKLVAHGGDTNVAVYPDKDSFDKVKGMEKQGGPAGLIGGLGESMMTKKINAGTPVKIVVCDDEGCQIQVLDGPSLGFTGYVSKDSVD